MIAIREVNVKEQAPPYNYKDLYHSFPCDDWQTVALALTWDRAIWTSDCDFFAFGRRKPYYLSFLAHFEKN